MAISDSDVVTVVPTGAALVVATPDPSGATNPDGSPKIVLQRLEGTSVVTVDQLDERIGNIDAILDIILGPDT